jgi:hypothetical protein
MIVVPNAGAASEKRADAVRQSTAMIFPRERQTPEALGALIKTDTERWWPLIRELGIKAE